jgi:hypothetical protein
VTARQGPETGGQCAVGNGADRIDENIADVDTILTDSPDSGTEFEAGNPTGEPLSLGRQVLVGLRLVDTDIINTRYGRHRITKYGHTFRDDQGRQYRWYGTNPTPLTLRGYRHPGRYRVLPEVSLTFSATVREIWPDGTVSISRPYIRLDRQPEATRRAYAKEYGIPLHELGCWACRGIVRIAVS